MSSTPEAGGVALKATLDYGPAMAALASFRAEVEKIEGAGANISKLQEGMARTGAQMKETLSGMQAVAEELDVIIKKTNDLSTAQARESESASEASRAQSLAMRAAIKDSEYLNKTLDQRQQVLSRISAALKGQSVQSLTKPQADVLNARYGQLAVTEYSGGALAASSQAQAQKVALEEAEAENARYQKALLEMDKRTQAEILADTQAAQAQIDAAMRASAEFRAKLSADELANFETARRLETAIYEEELAKRKAADAAVLAERAERESAEAAMVAAAAEEEAAVQREVAAQYISQQKASVAAAKLRAAEQAAAAREAAAAEAAAAADRVANFQTALAIEKELAAAEAQRVAASAKISDSLVLSQRAEQDAAHLAALRAQAAAEKELASIEASRNADLVASAAYLSSKDGARLRMLQQIAAAEKLSGSTVANNPALASKFPSAALADYTTVGAAQKTAHQLAADLEAVGTAGGHAAIGFHATAGTAREFTTIMKDLFTGEWSRMAASVTRLLTISGTFDGILSVLGLSLFAAGTATAVMAAAAIKGAMEQNQLNLALAQTGDIAGTTVSGLESIAEAAAHAGGTIGSAKEVVLELAQSGRYTAEQIQKIATSAGMLQEAGGNVENFVKQVESIKDNPTEAIYKLNEQYHFLTASTYEAIASAERHGDAVKAAGLAVDDFSSAVADRTKDVVANQGLMLAGWIEMKKLISETIDSLEGLGRKSSIGEQIAKLQAEIASDKAQGSYQDGAGGFHAADTHDKENQLFFLQEQLKYEDSVAKAKGEAAEKTRLQVQAERLLDAERKKVASPADKRKAEEERLRQGLAPLVGLPKDQGGITQQDVDDLVAKANAKYKDKKGPRGHIDPTNYNAAEEAAKLDAAALKVAQDRLAILKSMGLAIAEAKYANIEDLQITAEKSSYEASRQKILKEIQNAERNGNANSKRQLEDSLSGLEKQHKAKLTQIQLDYEEQKVARDTQAALLNINTVLSARTAILKDLATLYGTANDYDQNALDNAAEMAAAQKAQYAQAVQYQQLLQSGASQEEIALARQANVLSLATQIYEVEKDRQKLLMDNATTLANIYQQTLNAVEEQIGAIEKGRTTLADQVVSGFTSGTVKANESLFASFKSPQASEKYSLRDYTSNIGGGIYDSITSQLSKSMAESELKGFQSLLKAVGVTSTADAAREKAQQDLAVNTQSMTESLGVTIPDLLKQMLGYLDGTTPQSAPAGTAAFGAGGVAQSATTGSGAPYGYGGSSGGDPGAVTKQLDAASDSMKDFKQTGSDTFNVLGMNATQFSGLFYTGVVAATTGGKQAFKNFAAYAIEKLLELYAIQKLVGLATSAFAGAAGSENAGASATSTPDDLISGYTGHADGTSYVDSKGYVTAPGGSRDDTAIVRLSHGEAVLNADAVKRLGRRRIDAINQGSSRFADGGVVGSSPYSGTTSGGGNMSVAINVDASSKGGAPGDMQKAAQNGQISKELEGAVLAVFSKYAQPGGQIYTQIKQLTR